jgi:hypothetical protein
MSKVLFWVVLIFVVLFVVRLIGSAQAKKRRERDAPPAQGADMVRCSKCGTFVPRADAIDGPGGFRCREGNCLPRASSK